MSRQIKKDSSEAEQLLDVSPRSSGHKLRQEWPVHNQNVSSTKDAASSAKKLSATPGRKSVLWKAVSKNSRPKPTPELAAPESSLLEERPLLDETPTPATFDQSNPRTQGKSIFLPPMALPSLHKAKNFDFRKINAEKERPPTVDPFHFSNQRAIRRRKTIEKSSIAKQMFN